MNPSASAPITHDFALRVSKGRFDSAPDRVRIVFDAECVFAIEKAVLCVIAMGGEPYEMRIPLRTAPQFFLGEAAWQEEEDAPGGTFAAGAPMALRVGDGDLSVEVMDNCSDCELCGHADILKIAGLIEAMCDRIVDAKSQLTEGVLAAMDDEAPEHGERPRA